VVVGLLGYGVAVLPGLTFGSHFPGRSLERVFARVPGCVTSDDPITLIETGALKRNFDLRCPLVLDPGGYSYDLQPGAGRHLGRASDAQWQQFVQDHLAAGTTSVVVRFRTAPGLSGRTKGVISRWPVVADVAGYQVRHPISRTAVPVR
jgi:hypothetical protein